MAAALLAGASRALAQAPARVYRVGYLMARATPATIDEAFMGAMRDLGYTDGRNLVIEYRWAGNDPQRLRTQADELVRVGVDVIVTATTMGTRAAMDATRTIPIVTAATSDPVAAGLVATLGRPGGNVTGMSLQTTDMARKRLQQLREIVPGATRVAVLAEKVADVGQGTTGIFVSETRAAAKQMGVELSVREIGSEADLAQAFAQFRRDRANALVVQVGPLALEQRARIVELAALDRLPAMYEVRTFVDEGGLASYGPDLRDSYRRAATLVDRILRGAKPGDLPFQQPDRLSLTLNLRTAKALGLAIPPAVLARADDLVQ